MVTLGINLKLGNPRAQCPVVALVFWTLDMGILVVSLPIRAGKQVSKCPEPALLIVLSKCVMCEALK